MVAMLVNSNCVRTVILIAWVHNTIWSGRSEASVLGFRWSERRKSAPLNAGSAAGSNEHDARRNRDPDAQKTGKLVIGIDGGTESIRACCFDASSGRTVGNSVAVPYPTTHPEAGWAEQNPEDWYHNLGLAVRGALASVPPAPSGGTAADSVAAVCVDTTCCSVVALDDECRPLRPALLWMDARSAPQTREILQKCRGDSALRVNCDGEGPISAEWMTPKALWIKQNEPRVWAAASHICEYQDYINLRLAGVLCASSCNAAARWHWDGVESLRPATHRRHPDHSLRAPTQDTHPGRPLSLYAELGMPELAHKLPSRCIPMGAVIGDLTPQAAAHLGLNNTVPLVQGGPDAFVGMIGLGCIRPGQLCLITGSSHLHCVVTAKPTTAKGSWGAYKGAPLQTINFAEGGQSSTGSIIRWAKNIFGSAHSNHTLDYKLLDHEAANVPPGSDGLVALETFQGSRTPITDPLARGALIGLTLSHTRAHIWRALMEAVCFGTRACVDGLADAGHTCNEIVMAGGTTRSLLWLQMHADVTGKPVVLCENTDAPLLGCAVLASVGAGVHDSVHDAVHAMVRTSKRVQPRPDHARAYDKLYNRLYTTLTPAIKPLFHTIAQLRGGSKDTTPHHTETTQQSNQGEHEIIISPSLLASDWANISSEIKRCLAANLHHLHIDVFDGVFIDSPHALTFGPQMVKAMRSVSQQIFIDVHMCVQRPSRFVEPLLHAGANRLIFQIEAMDDYQHNNIHNTHVQALELAKHIVSSGMHCGISLNPETDVADIFYLLETGLFNVVDVLAVQPGFGGQVFQESALQKIKTLHTWIKQHAELDIQIMVDGGINEHTSKRVREAGATVLVAGTFLFQHPKSIAQGAQELSS